MKVETASAGSAIIVTSVTGNSNVAMQGRLYHPKRVLRVSSNHSFRYSLPVHIYRLDSLKQVVNVGNCNLVSGCYNPIQSNRQGTSNIFPCLRDRDFVKAVPLSTITSNPS